MEKTGYKKRPSWDEYFTGIVIATRQRSSCLKRHVGALVVTEDGKTLLATAYDQEF